MAEGFRTMAGISNSGGQIMKQLWIRVKEGTDMGALRSQLAEFGRVEEDAGEPGKLTLTFHNQSESGLLMAGFRLSQEFIHFFDDFDMVRESQ
jgi:hypothetical protein